MQLAIAGGRNVGEHFHIGGSATAGVGDHVKVRQQRLAVRQDAHHATPLTTATGILGTIERFRKVQMQFVGTRLQRNVVSKVSLAAAAINVGILGAPDVMHRTANRRTARKVSIRAPRLAGTVHIASRGARQNADFVAHRKAYHRPGLDLWVVR